MKRSSTDREPSTLLLLLLQQSRPGGSQSIHPPPSDNGCRQLLPLTSVHPKFCGNSLGQRMQMQTNASLVAPLRSLILNVLSSDPVSSTTRKSLPSMRDSTLRA